MRSMPNKTNTMLRHVRRIVTAVALTAIVSAVAHAQSAEQSVPDYPTICGEMAQAIKALPPSTDLYDWPDLINFPGLKHPQYQEEDPYGHIDIIKATYVYLTQSPKDLPGTPVNEATWERVKDRALEHIQQGSLKVESTNVKLIGLGDTKLYRISYSAQSAGTLGKEGTGGPVRLGWTYVIGEAEQMPQLHNWPMHPGFLRGLDLLLINGRAYFAKLPEGELLDITFETAPNPTAFPSVCEFHLWPRRKS
jgi:hypothetical protein